MNIRKIASVLVALIATLTLGFVLAGCSGQNNSDNFEKKAAETFVGTWNIVELQSGDQDMSGMLDLMREMGAPLTFDIASDGTLKIDMTYNGEGEVIDGTWKAKDAETITVTIKGSDGNDSSADVKYVDGKITLEEEGLGKLVCKK